LRHSERILALDVGVEINLVNDKVGVSSLTTTSNPISGSKHHYYPRYRHYYRVGDFWGWLAFTEITLAIIDNLNDQQQREHTLHEAVNAPVGNTIRWKNKDVLGSVTVTCV
jgi:hypothetical protein